MIPLILALTLAYVVAFDNNHATKGECYKLKLTKAKPRLTLL